jgi:1,4-dihydroxy-2-naphthoate octaprenyltransferase
MEESTQSPFVLFLRLSKPYLLISGLVQTFLGVGIAKYLGYDINWLVYWYGLLWVIAVQLGGIYLFQYFDLYIDVDLESRTRFFGGNPVLGTGEGKLPRRFALIAALGAFATAATLTIMLYWQEAVGFNSVVLMLLIIMAVLAYGVPPLQLSRSGYGELLVGLVVGFLIPAFSFELQSGTLHRLITQTTLPIVLLIVPLLMALTFQGFSTDLKHNRENLLSKIGLQNSVVIHNSLILLAYLSLAGAMFLGLPRRVGLTAFYAFPLGMLQVWLINRIAIGSKPSWLAVRINGITMISLTIVLIIFSYWIG